MAVTSVFLRKGPSKKLKSSDLIIAVDFNEIHSPRVTRFGLFPGCQLTQQGLEVRAFQSKVNQKVILNQQVILMRFIVTGSAIVATYF